ncbi:MAG TPA: hypothetical protein VFV67_34210 [Actinophytocola sp.]|uniref:hypothetical protein n=1 Tax=Actinophytocola sp. TaxID=1872138 RepID=UPI002DBD721E|nr:hypothetical protein [Actinophytocola sp.]HEU5475723.1 hypothetical protein [Actinophytocola sp.]
MFLAPTTCADDDPPSPPPPAKRRRVRATPKAPLTPEQRTLRAKVAAHTMWSNTSNRAERTAAARKAAHDRFAKQVDPGGVLPPEERAQRAENARKAHFCRMAAASAKARAAKAAGGAPRTTRSSQGSAS